MKNIILSLGLCMFAALACGSSSDNTESNPDTRGGNPAIQVQGARNLAIAPGGTAIALNGTKFFPGEVGSGTTTQRYIISNPGTGLLQLQNPAVRIVGSPYITVTEQPEALGILPGGMVEFELQFDRSVFGLHVATVEIPNNTVANPDFKFPVEGRAYNASDPVTVSVVGSLPIPDNNPAGVNIPFNVSGLTGAICTLQFRANGTNCAVPTETGIQHPWVGDLILVLTSPGGKTIRLIDRIGAVGGGAGHDTNHFCNTVLDDTGTTGIQNALRTEAPFSGEYRPSEPLYEVTGDVPNGLWNLNISDRFSGDIGTVRSISLVFTVETSPASARDWQLFQ